MENKKIKKLALVLVLFLSIIFVIIRITVLNKGTKQYKKYMMTITVSAIDRNDKKTEALIVYDNDGKNGKTELSFLNNPLYITERGEIFYRDGNRFKKVLKTNTYGDIYQIFNDVKVDKKAQDISKDDINLLLECLCIDLELNKGVTANYDFKEKNIQSVTIYLKDIYSYKNIDIMIKFKEQEKDFKIDMPIFYEKLTDEVDESKLRFLD